MKMKIFAALTEDAHQGWVCLDNPALPTRCVVKISNPANGKSVYCEALQLDENFLNDYNKPERIRIADPSSTLVVGRWYRDRLGGLKTQSEIVLEIRPANGWCGRFRSCLDHPQVVTRLAAQLGAIGLILGVIGLGLGVVSILK